MKYSEQLKTVQWLRKKKKILIRDNYTCTSCESKKNLQVHHIYYVKGKKAWQYPNNALIVLCDKCHKEWHDKNKIEVRDKIWNKNIDYKPPKKKGEYKKIVEKPIQEIKIDKKKESIKARLRAIRQIKIDIINNSEVDNKEELLKKVDSFTEAKLLKYIKYREDIIKIKAS